MKIKVSYEEIEKDIADLNGALKTLKKSASVEKVLNNIIANVRFQAAELQKREEELAQAKEFASSLISNLPLPTSLSTSKGVRLNVNKACLELYKRRKKKWIGAKLEEMYEKADAPKIRKAIEDCRNIGCSSCEVTAIRGDRTKFPVILNFSALKNKKGDITHTLCTATDITKLRKQEKELERSQEYLRSLLYSIPNPTSILDLSGKRIDTAKATEYFFRRTRDSIMGTKVKDLYAKEDLRKIKETMERGKEGYSSCEATCIRGDGTKFPAILSFAPVKDKEGNLINIAFSATDVTKLRKHEGKLRKRQQEQANTILSLSEVLSETTQGDLSARVNTEEWSEEFVTIGLAINTLIESLEYNVAEFKNAIDRFNKIKEVPTTLLAERDLKKVFEKIIESACKLTDSELGWLLLADEKKEYYTVKAVYGRAQEMKDYQMRLDGCVVGKCIINRESIIAGNYTLKLGKNIIPAKVIKEGKVRDSETVIDYTKAMELEVGTVLGVPIIADGEPIGTVTCYNKGGVKLGEKVDVQPQYTQDDVEMVNLLSVYAGIGIATTSYIDELRKREATIS